MRKSSYNVQEIEELWEERKKLRAMIIEYFGIANFTACIIPVKKLYKLSQKIYELRTKAEELYEYLADRLLFAKC